MPLSTLTRRTGPSPDPSYQPSPGTGRGYLLFGREVKEVDEVGVSKDAEFLEASSHTLLPRNSTAGLPPHAFADALGGEADAVRGRVARHGTEE